MRRTLLIEENILEMLYWLSPDINYYTNSITGEKLIVIRIKDNLTEYEAYFTHDAFIHFLTTFHEQVMYKLNVEGIESIYSFIAEIITHDFVNGVIPDGCDNSILMNGLIILCIEDCNCKCTINPMLLNTSHNIIVEGTTANTNHIDTAHKIIDTLLM